MRLYLSAKSKLNIGYTPDWLKVTYEQDGKDFELTLDIQGDMEDLQKIIILWFCCPPFRL